MKLKPQTYFKPWRGIRIPDRASLTTLQIQICDNTSGAAPESPHELRPVCVEKTCKTCTVDCFFFFFTVDCCFKEPVLCCIAATSTRTAAAA
jgi:hypothetical protein